MQVVVLKLGQVDLTRRRIDRADGGPPATLSPQEAKLLAYLATAAPRSVTHEELLSKVWGYAPGVRSRTVESTVHTLRGKIEVDPRRPEHLLTVRGEGYRWVPPPAPSHAALQAVRHAPDLPQAARDLVTRAVVEALALDDPAAGLAVLDELGTRAGASERAMLLLALGRVNEARRVVEPTGAHAFEQARLRYRSGVLGSYESLLREALDRSRGVARGKILLRLGVWCLDRGRVGEGYAHLEGALQMGHETREPMLRAMGWGEIGMYRTMQGHLEAGVDACRRSLAEGAPLRSGYLEKLARLALALGLRALGEDAEADALLAQLQAITTQRLFEPGVLKFQALERRLAGDVNAAWHYLEAGLARHRERTNLPDGAGIAALRESWIGEDPGLTDASAFTAAQIQAALGGSPEPALDMRHPSRFVASFGRYEPPIPHGSPDGNA